jgi:hypothetical protein
MPLRLNGSTSGYSQLDAPAIAGDQTFTLPGTGGTIDRLNRAGNILQVVQGTYSTQVNTSSSTYSDTGLTATITPTSASSKILVLVNQAGCGKESGNTSGRFRLVRNATEVIVFEKYLGYTASTATNYAGSCSTCYLDSPATTSATTYKTQFASSNNIAGVYAQASDGGSPTSIITLMEVAA